MATARRRRLPFPSALPASRAGDAWRLEADGRELRLSNLNKVYWPDDGITKGDLLAYYWNAAGLLLPHLHDRPLTMKRMPNGLAGEPFYEKQVPAHAPDWLPTAAVPTEEDSRVVEFVLAQDLPSLLYVVNLGCIEMHPLHSRAGSLDRPDYAFFDLDPFEPYTYEDVRTVAKLIKVVLDGLGLRGYPKTSGATGMQVFVPLDGTHTHTDAREFVERVGRLVVRAYPEKATMAWPVADRAGKIFIDHQLNRSGANIASVYSLRPLPGAPVSTPLDWDELDEDIEPGDFRIDNVWDRFAEVGDLFAGVRTEEMDLTNAFEALGVRGEDDEPRARGPLPRTAAKKAAEKSSDEIVAASKDPALYEYVRRREFGEEGTTEPAPGDAPGMGNSFVIHKHRATRLHYDVRLEHEGGLWSWAVPRGLPIQKGDKRLAVQTEVHPLEYGKFEGTIPEGHYGAGEVRIFDDGWYEPIEWTDTKVSFKLHGRRYPGVEYHFVKTRTDWLAFLASAQDAPLPAAPVRYQPMLAEGGGEPFDDPRWWFEPKLDGIRALAEMETGGTVFRTRRGRDVTFQYPDVHMIHELVDQVNAVLDGELVAVDAEGRSSFETLQQRMNLQNEREIKRVAKQIPVAFVAFDLLWLDGRETTGLSLEERRELLQLIVEEDHRLQLMGFEEENGTAFVEGARSL
ncbi:MAG TPA: DNA polymerase ligase N-terminal domain-containing protein, partial [Actinomycetes bacterium]|nr:DNA polymerase ligase N-terminal domain-containing protein [Actinomycetes bacterium]